MLLPLTTQIEAVWLMLRHSRDTQLCSKTFSWNHPPVTCLACMAALQKDIPCPLHVVQAQLCWSSLNSSGSSRLLLTIILVGGAIFSKFHSTTSRGLPTAHCSFTQLPKTLIFCHTNNTNGTSVKDRFWRPDMMYKIFRAMTQIVQ